MREGAKLTVGYDGSEGALQAVRWAVDAAIGHAATVTIVACYGLPVATDPWLGVAPVDVARVGEDTSRMVKWAAERVAPCSGDVRIEHRAIFGPAATALVNAAAGAICWCSGDRGIARPSTRGGSVPWFTVRCATRCAQWCSCPMLNRQCPLGGWSSASTGPRPLPLLCCGQRTRPIPGTRPSLSSTSGRTRT